MSKKSLYFFILAALFFGSLKFSDNFQKTLFFIIDPIKISYHNFYDYLENIVIKHINQEKKIESLIKENNFLKKYYLKYNAIDDELNSIKKECNIDIKKGIDLKLVRAISYVKLGDFSSLWLDIKDLNSSKIYGLIKDNFVAGIAIYKNGKFQALLNSNEKCSYAVEVGEKRAPGIAIGRKDGNIEVKYIPMYQDIKIGDEVVTNGLDAIFFYGVKVGKVIKIENESSYKVALVKPYANLTHPRYFWIVLKTY